MQSPKDMNSSPLVHKCSEMGRIWEFSISMYLILIFLCISRPLTQTMQGNMHTVKGHKRTRERLTLLLKRMSEGKDF